MVSVTRYYTVAFVESTATPDAITQFEVQWVSQFWYPGTVLYDPTFENEAFMQYLQSCDVSCRALPPRRQNKNVLE